MAGPTIDETVAVFPEIETELREFSHFALRWRTVYGGRDPRTDEEVYTVQLVMAHMAVAASQNPNRNADRAPTSVSVGEITENYSRTLDINTNHEEYLKTTQYGQLFLLQRAGHRGGRSV